MWEIFKNDLLKLRELKIASSFHCDPAISVRAATPEDRRVRSFHSHCDVYEILLVLDGACEIMIGDRVYSGGAGAALLIEPGIKHESFYPKTAPDGRHFWILCMPNYLLYNLFCNDGHNCTRLRELAGYQHCDPQFRETLGAIFDHARRSRGGAACLRELELLILLRAAQMARIREEAKSFAAYGSEKNNRVRIEKAMEYIGQQCGRDCDIDLLAQLAGCSRTHFTRLFRRFAKCSVLEYVDRQRLSRCKALPRNTPVKIFAEELGFSSASAFLHWRKQKADELRGADWASLTRRES